MSAGGADQTARLWWRQLAHVHPARDRRRVELGEHPWPPLLQRSLLVAFIGHTLNERTIGGT